MDIPETDHPAAFGNATGTARRVGRALIPALCMSRATRPDGGDLEHS